MIRDLKVSLKVKIQDGSNMRYSGVTTSKTLAIKTIRYPLTDFCLSAIFFNLKWTHMHAISYETTIWLMLFFSLEILQKYLTKMYSVYSTSYLVALQGSSNIYLITVFYIQIKIQYTRASNCI